jgi:hypothetical protein
MMALGGALPPSADYPVFQQKALDTTIDVEFMIGP